MAMNTGVGMGTPGMNPPKTPKPESVGMIGSALLLIHAAMERPAV